MAAQSGDRAGAEIFIREALEVAATAGDRENVNRALKLLDALAKYGEHSAATLAAIQDARQALYSNA